MKNLIYFISIALIIASCATKNNESAQENLSMARSNISLPENCLQFDSVGVGMKFDDARIIVLTDSDFTQVEIRELNGDSVIEFQHNFYLQDGGVTGFRGKINEYNDSVESIVLSSLDSGYDYPHRLMGTFLNVALTYKEKYGIEPPCRDYNPNSSTSCREYTWRKGKQKVTVSFETETLHPDNAKILYTGKLQIMYVDDSLRQQHISDINKKQELKKKQILDEARRNTANQNI